MITRAPKWTSRSQTMCTRALNWGRKRNSVPKPETSRARPANDFCRPITPSHYWWPWQRPTESRGKKERVWSYPTYWVVRWERCLNRFPENEDKRREVWSRIAESWSVWKRIPFDPKKCFWREKRRKFAEDIQEWSAYCEIISSESNNKVPSRCLRQIRKWSE